MISKLIYYIKSLFVPQVVEVYNGESAATYVMMLSRLKNGDWLSGYVTSVGLNGFSSRICECVTTSKYKALVNTYELLKEYYRWRKRG